MLVAIIGESCTGKSTLAKLLSAQLSAQILTGKAYLRFAKSEGEAERIFREKLSAAVTGEHLIYVIAEREHLRFLPEEAIRVRMTADLELICQRFARRMGGKLPAPVEQMLGKKHGIFDDVPCRFSIHNNSGVETVCDALLHESE